MKTTCRILALACALLCTWTAGHAADRVVGGDLSLVPAYESAGDKWLDESGQPISDLIAYVKDKGWNAVRVRLFVDPSQTTDDPAVCQDYDYVEVLGKRIKAAGMKFLLDFHYSDTWADPSKQKIPASWTDHSDEALASVLYTYTKTTVANLIANDATPDYVQIGNEITHGLLWNTSDGTYPANSSQYASAGYCTTWSSTYSTGATQWRRTASFLNNAAHGVRQAYADNSLDSTQVKIIVHTEMGSASTNSDNFYRHIATAGFTNYDIIGLSYYPPYHGALSVLGSLLTTLKSDFPSKPVHIVETAWSNDWYPSDADYSISELNSNWTADAQGQINYLADLIAYLADYNNAQGLYYWQPEECGNGYKSTVMNTWLNRGLWACSSGQKHSLVASGTSSSVATLATFAAASDDEFEAVDWTSSIIDSDFETSAHFNWDNGPWNPGDGFYLWDSTSGSNQGFYQVKTDSWAANKTNICVFWTPAAVTTSGSILYQTVSGLPNGTYTLTADICDQNANLYLYAGESQSATGTGNTSWNGVNTVSLADIQVTDGTLKLGIGVDGSVNAAVGGYVDNFTLTQTAPSDTEPVVVPDSIYWHEGIQYVYRQDGTAYVAGYSADDLPEEGVELLGEFEVDGATYYPSWIAEWAMEDFPLYWINIPGSITAIGKGAFYKSSLSHVTFFSTSRLAIYDYAFTGWDDTLEDDGNLGSKGSPFYNVTIYAENLDNVSISDKAFNADDIDEATLWVVRSLTDEADYTSLGFLHVYPIGVTKGDLSDNGDGEAGTDDIPLLVDILIGKTTVYDPYVADVNGDGEVTLTDLTALVNIVWAQE